MFDSVDVTTPPARPVAFRIGIYEAIRRTAEAQRSAVVADDLDRFYDLLMEREKLLDKAETVQQELDPADRARAGAVVREILRVDQETERILNGRIDEARTELSDVAVGRQALSAYGRLPTTISADLRA